jgi:hypothetical protein
MSLRRLVFVACTLTATLFALLSSQARAEDGPVVTKLSVYRAHVDQQFSALSINADTYIIDAGVVGTADTVHITYSDGTALGGTSGGYREVESTETSFSGFAGDVYEAGDPLPVEGPVTFLFEGGMWDGWLVAHDIDLRYQPSRPDLHPSSRQKLVKFHADKVIKLQLNGFTPAPGSIDAQSFLIIEYGQPGLDGRINYSTVFSAFELPPDAPTVELPARTLGVGLYRILLVNYQSSPGTETGSPVSYYTTHQLHVERAR